MPAHATWKQPSVDESQTTLRDRVAQTGLAFCRVFVSTIGRSTFDIGTCEGAWVQIDSGQMIEDLLGYMASHSQRSMLGSLSDVLSRCGWPVGARIGKLGLRYCSPVCGRITNT
jgi:hypothetical protein